jgi:RecB family exonuclease
LGAEDAEQWRETVRAAAAATDGPNFAARVNEGCSHCPIRPSCPAHNSGAHNNTGAEQS